MRAQFGNPPPAYRRVVKLLHWSVVLLVLSLLAFGNLAVLKWALIICVGVWYAGFFAFGLLARPSPALTGVVKNWFMPAHLVMRGLPGILAVAVANAPPGALTDRAWIMAVVTLGAGLLHGIFHLWRHTALRDGALRNMLPTFLHGVL